MINQLNEEVSINQYRCNSIVKSILPEITNQRYAITGLEWWDSTGTCNHKASKFLGQSLLRSIPKKATACTSHCLLLLLKSVGVIQDAVLSY